jgi:hypothetical protein
MEPTTFDQEVECNRRAYEGLKEQIRRDYAGQYVAIAFGRIVAVNPDFHKVTEAIECLQPAPAHAAAFLAEDEPAWEPYENSFTTYTKWFES